MTSARANASHNQSLTASQETVVSTAESKSQLRTAIWKLLQDADAVNRDPVERIPDFKGADAAAEMLSTTASWREATAMKSNPDRPQEPAREQALREDKRLYMAVPKLALDRPFYFLNSLLPSFSPEEAATSAAAEAHALLVGVEAIPRLDLVITGCVAVNRNGARLGKGKGYADIEYGLLTKAGLIDDDTILATTVHDLQVTDEVIPEDAHDFRLDLIVTPTEVIECPRTRRPHGIDRRLVTADQIAAIPLLAVQVG